MNAQDLMLGDLIVDGDENARVTSLTCDGIIETTRRISNVEVIEPIPITPEILERNGFQKNEMYFVCHLDEDFELWYYPHLGSLRYEYNGELIAKFPDAMNYVHQLQHALKMCGIDKEIIIETKETDDE